MLEIFEGPVNTTRFYTKCEKLAVLENMGALSNFTGIIRADKNEEFGIVDGLSFDIYVPLLQAWLDNWLKKLDQNTKILMAHSRGDVLAGQSSFACAILSRHRKISLKLLNDFVEDFKARAPIWKYDLIKNKRIYALSRSTALPNSGILHRS